MKDLQKKYVKIAKQNVINGIVVTYYPNMTQARCVDYIPKDDIEGYEKPLDRTAKQLKPLMGFTQIY